MFKFFTYVNDLGRCVVRVDKYSQSSHYKNVFCFSFGSNIGSEDPYFGFDWVSDSPQPVPTFKETI